MNPADIFGKLRVVRWNGFDFTLSLIRWGFLRRYRARRITFFDAGALFIPKYEIAVFEGGPEVVYSEAPEMVFYYPDKAAALLRRGDLESAIVEGGLDGAPMRDFIQDANPQRQHKRVLRASETVIAGRPANAEHALAESKKPQGPQGLAKSAVKGAEMRRWLFELLEEFENERGGIGAGVAADGMFYHPQLIEWFRKRDGLPESKHFLESLLSLAFSTPDRKRRIDEYWQTIVATFQEKPNTEDILLDKASKLSDYIILHLGIATDLYGMFIEVSPDKFKDCHEINDQLQELVNLEESALWFRLVNELANRFIRRQCPLFMHYFEDALGYHLAVQGALPEAVVNIVGTRIDEYSSYQKFSAEPEESWAGTVLWAAGKHLMEAIGFRPDALFQARFECLFLETVKETLVGELLTGIKASNKGHL